MPNPVLNVSRVRGESGARDGVAPQSSVKDVAAAAGVSLGTVSNVLNRPERVSARHPRAGRAGDGRAGLRAQRVGPPAPGRHQPHARLRDARRRQPVLHRRRPGHRGRGRGGRTSPCCSATATTVPSARSTTSACSSSSGCRGSWSPRSTRSRRSSTRSGAAAPPWSSSTGTRNDGPSARSPSTTCWAAGSRSSTSSTAATSRVAFVGGPITLGQVRDRLRRRARGLGRRPASRSDLVARRDRVADVARAARPASGWPGCRAPPPDGRVLRQRPDRARPAPARHRQRRRVPERPRDRRATTTSSSRPPPPYRSPRSASRATSSAAPPPSWLSTRPRTRRTTTGRCCSPPSWWPGSRPAAQQHGLPTPRGSTARGCVGDWVERVRP